MNSMTFFMTHTLSTANWQNLVCQLLAILGFFMTAGLTMYRKLVNLPEIAFLCQFQGKTW